MGQVCESRSSCAADRVEQAVEVLAARPARGQMSGDTRITLGRGGAGDGELGVGVQEFHGLGAPAWRPVGLEYTIVEVTCSLLVAA